MMSQKKRVKTSEKMFIGDLGERTESFLTIVNLIVVSYIAVKFV